jgi:hypothetical protein
MHVKTRMKERKIEKKLDSLYTHVLVQRERHYRYIGGVLKNHYSQDKFLSNLFAHLFPVFFYSFSIWRWDLDNLFVIFLLFTIIFYALILQKKEYWRPCTLSLPSLLLKVPFKYTIRCMISMLRPIAIFLH